MPLDRGLAVGPARAKPVIIGVYLGGALGFVVFILAGSWLVGLWAGILLMGLFSFAESPSSRRSSPTSQPPSIRDASYALYFTLAFGVGSLGSRCTASSSIWPARRPGCRSCSWSWR